MKYMPLAARIVLGLLFFVFGLNGFLNFLPMPNTMPEAAMSFAGALANTGYMFPLIKGTEVLAGALLLAGIAVPFALLILAPIVVNIVLFHLILAPGSYGMLAVIVVLLLYLAYTHRALYKPLFCTKCCGSTCSKD
jgi:uncharacterized membrane protein YphA (DoxX/SURF4 family)